jgi:TolB-like protein/tetratricopeptide (TPR) repeat protein
MLAALPRRLRAVVFFDIVESTRLMEMDEDGTVARWRDIVTHAADTALPRHGGRLVKSLGDGMLTEFETASGAVRGALDILDAARRLQGEVHPDLRLHLRIGMNLCEVLVDERDIYGDGVNVAARLMALAGGDEIVVTAAMRDQLGYNAEWETEDLGVRLLRNMQKPVRAFRVRQRGVAHHRPRTRGGARSRRLSIAVTPFRNLTGDAARENLLEGLNEEIVTGLSRLPDLFVIARPSSLAFRDSALDAHNVATALGVRYVLSGSLRAADGRVRLNVELIDSESGAAGWRDQFDAVEGNLFDLQDRITASLVARIAPYMRAVELNRARAKRPESMDAHELTIRAIDLLHRFAEEDFNASRDLLRNAIALDPGYATPHAWMARWHLLRIGQGLSTAPAEDEREASRHARLALERDETDHVALAVSAHIRSYLERDFEGAADSFERALAINPNSSLAWALSGVCAGYMGDGEGAVERVSRAIELSPFDPLAFYHKSMLAHAYLVAGRLDKAITWARRAMRENRCYTSTHRVLSISLALAGRIDEARAVIGELLTIEPNLTLARFRARYPARDAAVTARYAEALERAGLS